MEAQPLKLKAANPNKRIKKEFFIVGINQSKLNYIAYRMRQDEFVVALLLIQTNQLNFLYRNHQIYRLRVSMQQIALMRSKLQKLAPR